MAEKRREARKMVKPAEDGKDSSAGLYFRVILLMCLNYLKLYVSCDCDNAPG